ncbi:MAG TPA: hypothetical protein VFI03_03640 [Solirubrobacterales bacterium]|nr:hypothetical protein [Solirubrobacterales bacterium]
MTTDRNRRRNALGVVVVLIGFTLSVPSCGEEAPQLEESNSEQVVRSIQKAERDHDWKNWHQFCQAQLGRPRVDPPMAARLVLERTSIVGETRTFGRIVNGGTDPLVYGMEPIVDRLVDESWYPQRFVQDGTGVGFNLAIHELRPHQVSGCIEIPISDSWRPGLYRVRFSLESSDDQGSDQTIQPGAYFRVTSLASEK